MNQQNIVLLGATGSIGTQTLQLVERFSDQFHIIGMSARANAEKLLEYSDVFGCDSFYLAEARTDDRRQVNTVEELISMDMDHLIVADHGLESFEAVLKALAMRKRVSIANKELLIVHGSDIVYLAKEQQTDLIPLDSEHNALFQCLKGEEMKHVKRLIITAAGGPFRDASPEEIQGVTVDQVLQHPNWEMGKKTTVDSATLVNKAFEVIETHYLFDIPYEKIEVRLHPESIVHAMVEFEDGNAKMLAYPPDMRYSIGYALFYPERSPESLTGNEKSFDFDQDLHFQKIPAGKYPCFDYVIQTARQKPNSLRQLVENDQWAVDEFLRGKISFQDIFTCLQDGIE